MPGSQAVGLAATFKLIQSAQGRWRAVNAPHLVALVRARATFVNRKLVERPGEGGEPEAALPASACVRKRSISRSHGHGCRGLGMAESAPCP